MNEILIYFGTFFSYVGISLGLFGLGILVFSLTTPYNEFQLIADGDELDNPEKVAAAKASAYDLGGKIIGLSLVIGSALYHSAGYVELMIWGTVGIVLEVLAFYLFELLTPFSVRGEIPRGNVAVGIFSLCISVSTGLIMAALVSYR